MELEVNRLLHKRMYLFIYLAIAFHKLQTQKAAVKNFCFNASLEGFRLNVTVLQVKNVSSRIECILQCTEDRCCRSINYKEISSNNASRICELLHEMALNKTSLLQKNVLYDHVHIIEPHKMYNSSCFPIAEKDEAKRIKTYASCKEAFESNRSLDNGVHNLQLNEKSEIYQAYCQMSELSRDCRGGGWTLVMKIDGNKKTFHYGASLWTDTKTFHVEDGLNHLEEVETKLASYNNTSFSKICLGMRKYGTAKEDTKWIELSCAAGSLYRLIADGQHRKTYRGRSLWESLINEPSLQEHCNKEGFNIQEKQIKLRLGLISNNENNCNTPDSVIGFGFQIKPCGKNDWYHSSSGNIGSCIGSWHMYSYNNLRNNPTFGFIFVQ